MWSVCIKKWSQTGKVCFFLSGTLATVEVKIIIEVMLIDFFCSSSFFLSLLLQDEFRPSFPFFEHCKICVVLEEEEVVCTVWYHPLGGIEAEKSTCGKKILEYCEAKSRAFISFIQKVS